MKKGLALIEMSVAAADASIRYCYPCSLALLPDGRLMATFTAAFKDADGDGRKNGVAVYSDDFGRTWSDPVTLFADEIPFVGEAPPRQNFGDPNIAVMKDRVISYCQSVKHTPGGYDLSKAREWFRESLDSGRTWSSIHEHRHEHNYFAGMNHKALRLDDGSYVRGFSWERNSDIGVKTLGEGDQIYFSCLLRSTDGGRNWVPGQDVSVDVRSPDAWPHAIHGAGEPAYVQLPDGSLYMLLRTGDAALYETRSTDMGRSWDPPRPSPFVSHNCPAELLQLDTGEILVIYNDHRKNRSRLCARISANCRDWSAPKHFAPVGFLDEPEAAYPAAELLPDGSIAVVWGQYRRSNQNDVYKIFSARFTREWVLL